MARLRGSRGTSRRTAVTRQPPLAHRPKCETCGADAIYFSNIIMDEQYVVIRKCEEHKDQP